VFRPCSALAEADYAITGRAELQRMALDAWRARTKAPLLRPVQGKRAMFHQTGRGGTLLRACKATRLPQGGHAALPPSRPVCSLAETTRARLG
jgi:hypothetical protein